MSVETWVRDSSLEHHPLKDVRDVHQSVAHLNNQVLEDTMSIRNLADLLLRQTRVIPETSEEGDCCSFYKIGTLGRNTPPVKRIAATNPAPVREQNKVD